METNDIIKKTSNLDLIYEGIVEDSNCNDHTIFNIEKDLNDEIFYQRKGYEELATAILGFLHPKMNDRMHPLLIGCRGSGKTAVVKYILNALTKKPEVDFEWDYINCRDIDSSYKLMKTILRNKKKVPTYEILDEFKKYIQNKDKKQIIVLDEVDLLKDDDIFYNVSRDPKFENLQLIIITRTPRFYSDLTGDVKSSLRNKNCFFDTYDHNGIYQILLLRAQKGLKQYEEPILLHIALATQRVAFGDVRAGIKTLEYFYKTKDHPKTELNGKDVRVVPKEVQGQIENQTKEEYYRLKEGTIKTLNDSKLTILYFILTEKKSNLSYKKYVENAYCKVARINFFKQAEELRNLDLFYNTRIGNNKTASFSFNETIGEDNIELVKNLVKEKMLIRG